MFISTISVLYKTVFYCHHYVNGLLVNNESIGSDISEKSAPCYSFMLVGQVSDTLYIQLSCKCIYNDAIKISPALGLGNVL